MSENRYPFLSLGSICRLVTDGSHFSPTPREEGHPIINAKDIPNARVNLETCTRISESEFRLLKSQNCAPEPGDVLLSKDGTIGRVVHYKDDLGAVALSSIAILRPDSHARPEFLAHALRSHFFDQQLFRLQSGSALKRLVLGDIRKIEVPFPDGETQRRIAEILGTVDEVIEQTEALIAKQQQVKAGLMHDLFTRGVTATGELRPPHAEAPHLYHTSPLGPIPKEWDCQPIEQILAKTSSPMRSGPFGSALLKDELVESGIPLLGIDNIFVERFEPTFRRFVTRQKFNELIRYAVFPGDVIITIMGTVGRSCVVPESVEEALSSKHLWTMTFDAERVLPDLVCWQLNHARWVKDWFARHSQGAVMEAIQSSTLRNLRLPVPPIAEQQLMQERYEVATRTLAAETAHLAKLRQQKQGLMHDLLTARVPVPAV